MDNLNDIVESVSEEELLKAQESVEVMRHTDGCLVHVRMIAYDDLTGNE